MGLRGATGYISEKTEGRPLVGVEIGVRDGGHANIMLSLMNIQTLYLVDFYQPYQDGSYFRSEEDQKNWYKVMFERMLPYSSKVILITTTSEFAATLFKDSSLDFVYIDGGHDKDCVLNDLKFWWGKIGKGGFLGGHDFTLQEYPGVAEAVKEFCRDNNLGYKQMPETDWLIEKIDERSMK